ncbi:MAG: IS21 family transposase, partial [Phycisphaerae bacterium]|nr:IS21 family transposase [Phycisphaerae bacterium]
MAYRELCVIEVKEVLRIWSAGRSYRAVARQSGVDRKTVRRYVETARALGFARGGDSRALDDALVAAVVSGVRPGGRREAQAMRLHCRTHRALIEGWLGEGCKGPKVVKLLGRHTGVVVPLRTLQRFITEEFEETERRGETVRIVDPPPGQVLEVDFLELGVFEERGSGRRRK